MDPEETLALLKDAIRNEDHDEAAEYYEYLKIWLIKEGFKPLLEWDQSTLFIFLDVTRLWLRAKGHDL